MAPGALAGSKRSFARAPDLAESRAVALPASLLRAPHCHTRPEGGRSRAGWAWTPRNLKYHPLLTDSVRSGLLLKI